MVAGPTAAVAVLTMVAGDAVVVEAVTVNVADPPTTRSIVVAMFPDPEAGHEEPAVAAQVHVAPTNPLGTVSRTVTPRAGSGPMSATTTEYATGWPAPTMGADAVFVTHTSDVNTSVSMSLATLFAGFGSVVPAATVADTVLVKVPVEVTACIVMAKVMVPAAARSTVVLTAPLPDAVAHDDPADAAQVQEARVTPVGRGSSIRTPEAADGPAFATVIV